MVLKVFVKPTTKSFRDTEGFNFLTVEVAAASQAIDHKSA
jgi:hypothetical protein